MSYCQCITWAREAGPLTDHHPHCQAKIRVAKISFNDGRGPVLVLAQGDIGDIFDLMEENDEEVRLTFQEMRAYEYETLPEFES